MVQSITTSLELDLLNAERAAEYVISSATTVRNRTFTEYTEHWQYIWSRSWLGISWLIFPMKLSFCSYPEAFVLRPLCTLFLGEMHYSDSLQRP